MSAATFTSADKPSVSEQTQAPARFPWISLGVVAVYWVIILIVRGLEIPFFIRFLLGLASPFLLFLFFSGWWWSRRRVLLIDRALGFALVFGGAFVAGPLAHPSLGLGTALMGWLPMVMSVWIVWQFAVQRFQIERPWLASLAITGAVWGSMLLLRTEGVDGDLRPDFQWRWSQTAEEQFLANSVSVATKSPEGPGLSEKSPAMLQAGEGDWTGFRGPNRDSKVFGTKIDTDWNQNPPKLLWKQRIGPGWSSVCIVGDRLFTQEQRGEQEAVVCYDANTGKQIWAHEDTARFYESVSSAGPRATPTFAGGRLYTLGATEILNCLDAGSGQLIWKHDLKAEAENEVPMWGNSSSPLVVDGQIIVYGGGDGRKNLLSYDAQTGKPLWGAEAGKNSYASPHFATLGGKRLVLMLCDHGLVAVDPENGGKEVWRAGQVQTDAPRSLQPQILDDQRLALGTFELGSLSLVIAESSGEKWSVEPKWTSASAMKPEFSDLIVHKGNAYGFDGAIFCCVDVETGERLWKGGRYGRGQVLLLADQDLLLVLSEKGEAILVEASPEGHHELARINAIKGKTWNHPVIAHGRLYVRNAEEIACYELPTLAGAKP